MKLKKNSFNCTFYALNMSFFLTGSQRKIKDFPARSGQKIQEISIFGNFLVVPDVKKARKSEVLVYLLVCIKIPCIYKRIHLLMTSFLDVSMRPPGYSSVIMDGWITSNDRKINGETSEITKGESTWEPGQTKCDKRLKLLLVA